MRVHFTMARSVNLATPSRNLTGSSLPDRTPHIVWLQSITLLWMLVECGVSVYGAVSAHSSALLAFGADSFVELLSATVVLLAIVPSFPLTTDRASRLTGILLFVLAGVVALVTLLALVSGVTPETSCSGIAITLAALAVMPILAWAKRKVALQTNNRALAADAVQSATCAYLAAITLAGLAINAVWHIHWVDSVAVLVALPILIVEGRRGLRGESCGCC
jgi:divalent metal cation (Fe/Co/Zn/Cd) transporter